MAKPVIVGLLKARNEVIREGNIYRCLDNMRAFCNTIVVCDDASTDGTDLVIEDFCRRWGIPLSQFLRIAPAEQDFRKELAVKERMLQLIHPLKPDWIWWQDADEIVPTPWELRRWIAETKHDDATGGYRFKYTQLWRDGMWARTDDGFDESAFVKLWRWNSTLEMDHAVERTHHMQFPRNLGNIVDAPPELPVIHFGNYGKNLQMKCIQYHGGLGGVDRHLNFENATYRLLEDDYAEFPVLQRVFDAEGVIGREPPRPKPFTSREKMLISMLGNMTGLSEWFTVVIPTHNRAAFLDETLRSLQAQTYQKWIGLVLDDGSEDNTRDVMQLWQRDPRILYAPHPKRGAVAMNEIGMRFACHATEWWTRLGSDDYWMPDKLLNDAIALRKHGWCYGPYRVLRDVGAAQWEAKELCNNPEESTLLVDDLLKGRFRVSWANMAVRTSLLKRVHAKHGNFVDPRLNNMEDFLFNARLAQFAEPVFRGRFRDGLPTVRDGVGAGFALAKTFDETRLAQQRVAEGAITHDAIWRVNPIGASASTDTTTMDDELTRELIKKENEDRVEPT